MSLHFDLVFTVILISTFGCFEGSAFSARVFPAVKTSGGCPSGEMINAVQEAVKREIEDITGEPILDARSTAIPRPACGCGGPEWTRIAHLNMSDPNQQCPANWNLITTPVRGCGRPSAGCHSAFFPSNGRSYTRVCGRVNAYQSGTTDAFSTCATEFFPWNAGSGLITLEAAYVDGVSLTHGAAGSRQHIWTFAAALSEMDPSLDPSKICACTNADKNWPYQVPEYVGDNYFCDTGNPGPETDRSAVYSEDPLWDGEGCSPTSACCQFNTPPWFCTTMEPTSDDDLELRICLDHEIADEDVIVDLVDIYIM